MGCRVGPRTGAPTLDCRECSSAFAVALNPAAINSFPAPAASNVAGGFPALPPPVCFVLWVMGPIQLRRLSADKTHPVAVEQPHGGVQPLRTPPFPGEAPAFPGPQQVTPNFDLYPALDELEAPVRVANGEVIHPAAQYRVDGLHPLHGLGVVSLEPQSSSASPRTRHKTSPGCTLSG